MSRKTALTIRLSINLSCLLMPIAMMTGQTAQKAQENNRVTLLILGIAQDAGSPHVGCTKSCCTDLFQQPERHQRVVSLGIIDHDAEKTFLFEATPDLPAQMHLLQGYLTDAQSPLPDGIFLTHAHIGHYTGLMFLGREGLNSAGLQVYAMPQMKTFLTENGPWSQLVELDNININELAAHKEVRLTEHLRVTPFLVPHRDEFSETVGYLIAGPEKSAVFIPDIDKWEKWDRQISEVIRTVDFAFLDGTFYDGDELPHRDISEVPHPFIVESMTRFDHLPPEERSKIHFIHLNHTNPALNPDSPASAEIRTRGYYVAREGDLFGL